MKVNPDDPAFPDPMRGAEQSFSNQTPQELPAGMSIRTQIAAGALKGMLANTYTAENWHSYDHIAVESVKYADALIAELNKS